MEVILVINDRKERTDLRRKVQAVYKEDCISAFPSGEDALDYAKNRQIDVCFTEVILTRMSGIALAKELRKQNDRVKINFISDTKEYAMDGWKLFIHDYLLKPVSISAIQHSRER